MSTDREALLSYARVFVALTDAARRPEQIEEQLTSVQQWLDDEPDVRRFLGDPTVALPGKLKALDELLDGRVHTAVRGFLLMLVEEKVFHRLDSVVSACRQQLADRRGAGLGEVVTNRPLRDEQVAAIEEEVSRLLGRPTRLKSRTDRNIIGGVRVQVGDFVIDGTVEYHLDKARDHLLG